MCSTGAERLYEDVRGSSEYPENLEELTQRFLAQQRITERKRTAYHLWYECGMNYKEIREQTGIDTGIAAENLRQVRIMYANYWRKLAKGTPLDDLSELDGRTYGILERAGFATVEQLEDELDNYGDLRLNKLDGLGKKNMEIVRRSVWNYEHPNEKR